MYEPPRFMSVNTALEQLLEVEEARGEGAYSPDTLCVGLARVGADSQQVERGRCVRACLPACAGLGRVGAGGVCLCARARPWARTASRCDRACPACALREGRGVCQRLEQG